MHTPSVYNAHMAVIQAPAWQCDRCGYIWLKVKDRIPTNCPNRDCRSRKWNSDRFTGEAGRTSRADSALETANTRRASEQPDKPFGIAGVVWGTQAIDELKPVITKELEPEQELCGYRAYNDVDGEWYRCGREKGHGIKHSEWIKET